MLLVLGGGVMVCGDNRQGQLGLGHRRGCSNMSLVEGLSGKGITRVYAGGDTTIALNEVTGLAFGCGYNEDGQLGVGHLENVEEPVMLCEGRRVVGVACGYYHVLFGLGRGDAAPCEGKGGGAED